MLILFWCTKSTQLVNQGFLLAQSWNDYSTRKPRRQTSGKSKYTSEQEGMLTGLVTSCVAILLNERKRKE
jgi:hypothetical protein